MTCGYSRLDPLTHHSCFNQSNMRMRRTVFQRAVTHILFYFTLARCDCSCTCLCFWADLRMVIRGPQPKHPPALTGHVHKGRSWQQYRSLWFCSYEIFLISRLSVLLSFRSNLIKETVSIPQPCGLSISCPQQTSRFPPFPYRYHL